MAQGRAWRGIVVDGAGIGSCMAANKVPGVLAAMCYDPIGQGERYQVLAAAAEHNVMDIETHNVSLEEIFLAYYSVENGDDDA